MENKECEHEWLVLTEAKCYKWETFMSSRNLEEIPSTTLVLTHTLICEHCRAIKKVN